MLLEEKEGCLSRGKLSDSLGALRDSVLGKLSWKDEPDSSLDLARGDCGLLVVSGQLSSLRGNFVEDVVDEAVEDGHSLGADASIGVHLRGQKCFRDLLMDIGCIALSFQDAHVRFLSLDPDCKTTKQIEAGECLTTYLL